MVKHKRLLLFVLGAVFLMPVAARPAETVRTLAILPFENNSVTGAEQLAPLCNGLPVMLMTELSNADTKAFKLIEREKIKALLDEISLGQSGAIDSATAVKVGKLLGAQSIAFGAFMAMGKMMRIDTRLIEVETGEVIMAASISGQTDNFLVLLRDLAARLARSMQVSLAEQKTGSKSDIEAAVLFARGVDAMERGASDE
ncbi:MAG: CsgG/HfaB family protein, partial [Desulfosudaceae bacterium]